MSFSVSAGVPTPTFTPDGQWVTFPDCRSGACGVWSRHMPDPDDPAAPPNYREDVTYPVAPPAGAALDWEPLIDEPVIRPARPDGSRPTRRRSSSRSPPRAGHLPMPARSGRLGGRLHIAQALQRPGRRRPPFDVRFYVQGQSPDDAPSPAATGRSTRPRRRPSSTRPRRGRRSPRRDDLLPFTEPDGATFACSQDAGPEYDCSSPQRLSGLGDGQHSFAVKAIDDVGNEQRRRRG